MATYLPPWLMDYSPVPPVTREMIQGWIREAEHRDQLWTQYENPQGMVDLSLPKKDRPPRNPNGHGGGA